MSVDNYEPRIQLSPPLLRLTCDLRGTLLSSIPFDLSAIDGAVIIYTGLMIGPFNTYD